MAKNILLTGATGFIGSQILNRLIEKNYKVVVLLRPTSDIWRIAHLKDNFTSKVIVDSTIEFDHVFRENNIDTIIHLATEYGRTTQLSSIILGNVIFPIKLIEAGLRNGLKRFINTDTFLYKYPQYNSYLKNYTGSKKIFKDFLIEYSNQIQIDSLRLEHPYGEYDSESKFVSMLVKELLQNKENILFTSGEQKRDFIYVLDVVEAFIKVLENGLTLENYFSEYEVGTGSSISVREFVERVANVIQSNTRLDFGALQNREGETPDSSADISKLSALGWAPQYNIESAIARIIKIEKTSPISPQI
jgi:nucleoside-diphosphate-sugar epimerase